jgi:hypothetical protein
MKSVHNKLFTEPTINCWEEVSLQTSSKVRNRIRAETIVEVKKSGLRSCLHIVVTELEKED